MERNVLKERLMNKDNKDDKNRDFVLLIIDISKHGVKEMGHVKMEGPGFVNAVWFRSGIRYVRVQTFFAGSVCTQCKCMLIFGVKCVHLLNGTPLADSSGN
jgi:hypothetical protein